MKSKLLEQKHDDIIALCKCMSPEERLIAFYNHSRLMHEFYRAGLAYRNNIQEPGSQQNSPQSNHEN